MTQRTRPGFQHIDLIVLLAIVATSVGLLLPAVHAAQKKDKRKHDMTNLKDVSLAAHTFHDIYKQLPPAFQKFGLYNQALPVSIHVHMLPWVEQQPLSLEYLDKKGGGNTKDAVIPPYIADQDPIHKDNKPRAGIQNFAANLRVFSDKGANTQYDAPMPALGDTESGSMGLVGIADGTSNTIMFATKYAVCGEKGGSRYAAAPKENYAAFFGQNPAKVTAKADDATATFQLAPTQKQCLFTPLMAQSFADNEILVGMADASVRPVSAKVSAKTWNCAVQPNDGFALGADW